MNGELSLEVQQSVFQILNNDLGIQSLVGGPGKVFDYVPQGTAYPYIVIGETTSSDYGDKDNPGQDMSIPMSMFIQGERESTRLRLFFQACARLFHEKYVGLTKGQAYLSRFQMNIIRPMGDGVTRQGYYKVKFQTSDTQS